MTLSKNSLFCVARHFNSLRRTLALIIQPKNCMKNHENDNL